jgi:hypothetical protein
MKKFSFLFVAIAFVSLIALNSCKSSTPPPTTPAVQEAAPVADTAVKAVADTASVVEE